jgi:hypothetical protein
LPPESPTLAPGIVHSNFSVQGDARHSFLAWQERMSPVYDIQPPSKQGEDTFDAALSRYTIDNLSFFDIAPRELHGYAPLLQREPTRRERHASWPGGGFR